MDKNGEDNLGYKLVFLLSFFKKCGKLGLCMLHSIEEGNDKSLNC
jgi:hypothetical protein